MYLDSYHFRLYLSKFLLDLHEHRGRMPVKHGLPPQGHYAWRSSLVGSLGPSSGYTACVILDTPIIYLDSLIE